MTSILSRKKPPQFFRKIAPSILRRKDQNPLHLTNQPTGRLLERLAREPQKNK